jgi:hypothetical protein
MACGVTKNGVTCDNTGTSAHTGLHSGVKNMWGFQIRVYWDSVDVVTAALKRPLLGVTARLSWPSNALINPNPTAPPPVPPPVDPVLTPMGMEKTASQGMSSSWTKVTGMAVRAGFPDTEIDDNCLVMDALDTCNVIARLGGYSAGGFGTSSQFRILKNGTVIGNASYDVSATATIATSTANGDKIWMEARYTGGFGGSLTAQASVNNYVYTVVT